MKIFESMLAIGVFSIDLFAKSRFFSSACFPYDIFSHWCILNLFSKMTFGSNDVVPPRRCFTNDDLRKWLNAPIKRCPKDMLPKWNIRKLHIALMKLFPNVTLSLWSVARKNNVARIKCFQWKVAQRNIAQWHVALSSTRRRNAQARRRLSQVQEERQDVDLDDPLDVFHAVLKQVSQLVNCSHCMYQAANQL